MLGCRHKRGFNLSTFNFILNFSAHSLAFWENVLCYRVMNHGAPPPLGSPGGCHRHPRMTNGRWSLSTRLYLSGSPCLVGRDPLWRFSRRGPSPPARSPCSYAHVLYAWWWPNSPTKLLRLTAASARAHEAHCELKIPTDSLQKHSSSACTEFVVERTGDSS